jgi:hypothetical protein
MLLEQREKIKEAYASPFSVPEFCSSVVLSSLPEKETWTLQMIHRRHSDLLAQEKEGQRLQRDGVSQA